MTQNRRNQAAGSKEENMKRRKGLERALAMTLAAFLSFTTIANDYAIVNAEEIETTGTETVQNAENNTTGGDTAATQSQQDTAAGTGSTEQKSGTESAAAGTSTGTATSTQSEAVTTTGTATETTTETATETTTETTTETKTEAEVKKPAVDLSQDINGVTIALHADEGILPEGVQMQVKEVSSQVTDGIRESIEKDGKEKVDTVIAYDITLVDKSGNSIGEEWSKDGKVQVTFSGSRISDASDNADKLEVLHVDNDGNVQNQEKSEQTNGKAVDSIGFDATHFSIYAVVSVSGIVKEGEIARTTYNFYNGKNKNGEDNLVDSQIVTDGESLTEPDIPTGDRGTTFLGWSENATPDTYITFGDKISVKQGADTTVNLYARFSDSTYDVTFHDQNGNVLTTKTVAKDGKTDASGVTLQVASDKALTGWTVTEGSTEKFDFDNTSITEDVDLYPVIESVSWVYFDSNGGSKVAPEYVAPGEITTEPAAPTKPGFNFIGWHASADLSDTFSFGSTITKDMTLYAEWSATKVSYTVICWKEDADDARFSYWKAVKGSGNAGEKTAATGIDAPEGFTAKAIEQQTINGDGSTIVNVYFTRNVYTIYFDKKTTIHHGGLFGWDETVYIHYDDLTISAKYGANIADQWPSIKYPGKYAANWRIKKDGTKEQAGIDVMPLGGHTFYELEDGSGNDTGSTIISRIWTDRLIPYVLKQFMHPACIQRRKIIMR